jgi:hypothetical protein
MGRYGRRMDRRDRKEMRQKGGKQMKVRKRYRNGRKEMKNRKT